MYLLSIDDNTGLIKNDLTNDSWKGIGCFRKLVDRYGLEALTTVAFTVDYDSPFRYYSNEDRGRRSMEEVFGDRDKFDLSEDIFLECFEKYRDLQFNLNMEQERINREVKLRLLKKLSDANEKDLDDEIMRINQQLAKHEQIIRSFDNIFDREAELKKSVTSSGYKLSRIEIELLNKNNKFTTHGEKLKNPDKLSLTKKEKQDE